MLECSHIVCAFRTMAHIRILYRSRLKMILESGHRDRFELPSREMLRRVPIGGSMILVYDWFEMEHHTITRHSKWHGNDFPVGHNLKGKAPDMVAPLLICSCVHLTILLPPAAHGRDNVQLRSCIICSR